VSRAVSRVTLRASLWWLALTLGPLGLGLIPRPAAAQCFPPASSNEARLLAHYEVPIAFATADAPIVLQGGAVAIAAEVAGVPAPSEALQQVSYCYTVKQDGSHLAPVLPRLRVAVGLPAGFAIEAGYLPPVTVDHAHPDLGSVALSYAHRVVAPSVGTDGPAVTVSVRVHGTTGTVVGPITCPSDALQQTASGLPCYGTKPSSDTFHPTSAGAEAAAALALPGRISVFGGGGYTWLSPRFRVGFTDLNGATDRTLVAVDLRRAAVFGGVSIRVVRCLDAAAEVYSVPADLTTWRLTARWEPWSTGALRPRE
jgi:hypothetical protein